MPGETSVGLTYARQPPLGADVECRDPAASPTALWQQLFDPWGQHTDLPAQFVTAVRMLAAGRTHEEFYTTLKEIGVDDALHEVFPRICTWLTEATDRDEFWTALDTVRKLGSGRPLGLPTRLDDIQAVLSILEAANITPQIVLQLPEDFRETKASQRREWCDFLADLAEVCDIRLIVTGLQHEWLAETHRDQLPGVSDRRNSRLTGATLSERVERARDHLSHDDREVAVLRALADASGESLTYSELTAQFEVSGSRVRQCISTLARSETGLGLLETFDTVAGKQAKLLDAGREYLDWLDSEIGRQQEVSAFVNSTSTSSDDSRVTPGAHVEAGEGGPAEAAPEDAQPSDRIRLPHHHEVRYLNAEEMARMGAAPPEGGFSVTNYPIEPQDDRGEAGWGYDEKADRLYITSEATGVLQHWVCHARALANWRTWEHILTEDRLEESNLDELVSSFKEMLRGSRCLGYLPDDVQDATEYADALQDALHELLEMTRDWANDNYEDEKRFRSAIIRESIGLVGTMEHVLDLAGVDVVREMRLPNFTRDFDAGRQQELLKTLATATAVLSKYNHSTAYRQLFEDRDDHRKWAIEPTVDAADPFGEMLGAWSIVGDFGDQAEEFASALRTRLQNPKELHEDAPEFAVGIPVRHDVCREQFRSVLSAFRQHKGLIPTPEAVSLLHGLARTPYDAAEAVSQLAPEESQRHIRIAEVRYALQQLDPNRLLRGYSGHTTTPRKLLAALLEADAPLSKTALDEAAGVSADSRGEHLPDLVTAGLVVETDSGYRLQLAFDTEDERYTDRMPAYVRGAGGHPSLHKAAKSIKLAYEHYVENEGVEWRRCRALTGLRHPEVWVEDLLVALWGLTSSETYRDRALEVTGGHERTAIFGQTPNQQAVVNSGTTAKAAD